MLVVLEQADHVVAFLLLSLPFFLHFVNALHFRINQLAVESETNFGDPPVVSAFVVQIRDVVLVLWLLVNLSFGCVGSDFQNLSNIPCFVVAHHCQHELIFTDSSWELAVVRLPKTKLLHIVDVFSLAFAAGCGAPT